MAVATRSTTPLHVSLKDTIRTHRCFHYSATIGYNRLEFSPVANKLYRTAFVFVLTRVLTERVLKTSPDQHLGQTQSRSAFHRRMWVNKAKVSNYNNTQTLSSD